jgi:hypothetical protein
MVAVADTAAVMSVAVAVGTQELATAVADTRQLGTGEADTQRLGIALAAVTELPLVIQQLEMPQPDIQLLVIQQLVIVAPVVAHILLVDMEAPMPVQTNYCRSKVRNYKPALVHSMPQVAKKIRVVP